jgi:hypothetical protein
MSATFQDLPATPWPVRYPWVDAVRCARSHDELRLIVLAHARHIAAADGSTFVLRDGDHCFYVDEDVIAPLWRGQRFPLADCISGWAMLHDETAVVPFPYTDARIPHDAYRPTFVQSLAMVPMADSVGAIGVYWAEPGHVLDDVALTELTTLGRETADAVRRLGLHSAPWAPNFRVGSVTPPSTPVA